LRVVFDTNIFISAFAIPGGKAEEAFLLGLKGKFTLCSSIPILTETARKLKGKFGWDEDRIIHLLTMIAGSATIVEPRSHLHLLTDEPDNRILECSVEAKADFIVTGDKHLLSLKSFKTVEILTLSDFLKNIS